MQIFNILKKDEGWREIKYPLAGWRLEPMGVPPNQSNDTTSP
jgi:hypothetical protein